MRSHGGASRTRVAVLPAAHPAVRRITGLGCSEQIEIVPMRPGVVNGESHPGTYARDPAPPPDQDLDHVDVAHVHFGYDYLNPESARDVIERLSRAGVPMVLTVHDIVYPSHEDAQPHRSHTGMLVGAATQVLTLTEVAARELWVRWGVDAMVVPHPRLLDEAEISAAIRASRHLRAPGDIVVGVLLERMGENIEGPELLDLLAPVAAGRRGAHLRIVVESQAWRDACGEDRESGGHHLVAELAAEGGWESVRLTRYEARDLGPLLAEFAALDVCVLPYRFATHSTWLEMCRDLGVAPVLPAVGFLREQWFDRCDPDEHSGEVYDPRDPGSLTWAVHTAIDEPRSAPPRVVGADPRTVMATHERVYRAAARRREAARDVS
ncbi:MULTISPECIES: hypothetical protein [unclassified Dietzia]|uniref:hypothetical protein n=1 Tax=unclassified Dietzia TaxID=2617939 RepID=UPI0018875869|nr:MULTISPECIES: hypothetical protein [unclassified Dietzia]